MYFFKKRNGGFTLIEVLTVIAIIGILSAVVLVSVSNSQKKGRDGRRVSDINQIRLALSLYYDAHNYYPPTATDGTAATALGVLSSSGYIATLPDDPTGSNAHYGYVATNCTSGSTPCYGYVLGANLETSNALLSSSYKGTQAITVNTLSEDCSTTNPQNSLYLYCATN